MQLSCGFSCEFYDSYVEMLRLRTKFNDILTIDRDYNGYMIRSLYFDSINDEDYYDKLNGEMNRKKIRLRIYDPKGNLVKLELKAKYDYHQLKESLIITKEDAKELIKGNYSILLNYNEELAKRIYVILMENYYKPKVIIEYNRIAYIGKTTTRITFDFEIKSSNNVEDFFEENANEANTVLDVRKIFGISNLLDTTKIKYAAAYRAQTKNSVDPYVLFAWQRMCELLTDNIEEAKEIDLDKLRKKLPEIKEMPKEEAKKRSIEVLNL